MSLSSHLTQNRLIQENRYKLNICKSFPPLCRELSSEIRTGDVGGQKTLRSYWRNYFEKTDALIWVVDATDRLRIDDCREELAGLLLEEVGFVLCRPVYIHTSTQMCIIEYRLIY